MVGLDRSEDYPITESTVPKRNDGPLPFELRSRVSQDTNIRSVRIPGADGSGKECLFKIATHASSNKP
jgi:hypothetical protein